MSGWLTPAIFLGLLGFAMTLFAFTTKEIRDRLSMCERDRADLRSLIEGLQQWKQEATEREFRYLTRLDALEKRT